jgi:peptidoglycan-N-acetylglucosamine deacetylase
LNPWEASIPAAVAAGIGATLWAAISPASQLFGPTLHRLPVNPSLPRIALTFDDGPNPLVTQKLLDLLDRHQVAATFFVIGRFARACPDLVREIHARGHLLGNHTDTHPHLAWRASAAITRELRRCEESVAEALAHGGGSAANGATMKWMRPPFGFRGPQVNRAIHAVRIEGVAMWSRVCRDWRPQPARRLIERLARVRASDIVLMHDGDHRALNGDRGHILPALEHWLPRWLDAGVEFVTIDGVAARERFPVTAGN